jgi:hypothetical protein
MYIMNTTNKKIFHGNFLLFPKFARFGHIHHKICGYFSQGKSTYKQRKEKKFFKSQENEVKRVIFFVKILLFIQRTVFQ